MSARGQRSCELVALGGGDVVAAIGICAKAPLLLEVGVFVVGSHFGGLVGQLIDSSKVMRVRMMVMRMVVVVVMVSIEATR